MLKKPYKLFFGTLANNQRLEIINFLIKSPKTVTQICRELKFNQTTVSHNLNILKKCSFVFFKKNGKERIYSINKDTIGPLMKLIDNHTEKFCKYLCGCKT
ncbi:winged helix-turn-helix transcriptional regulator [Candidatus Woesearchaeota archaeon]|nr:winged helix-turn-helix transcriptional regulator [Candidatus Woesearchaeota archaeon]